MGKIVKKLLLATLVIGLLYVAQLGVCAVERLNYNTNACGR